MHKENAILRGIKNGDIIKIYNDRGAVLGVAHVTERICHGIIHSYEASAIYDPLEPGKPYSIDRGGCVNILTYDIQECSGICSQLLSSLSGLMGSLIEILIMMQRSYKGGSL